MRKLFFLLPGTRGKFVCGGLFAELKTLKLAQHTCAAEVVTYRQREANTLFLEDVLGQDLVQNGIFVVSWGFDVPRLISRLRGYPVVYHAHSAGYGFKLPMAVPIIAVSRNTMGYWGQHSPSSPVYYLPNQISPEFVAPSRPKDIDVLVQARKSSSYLINQLVPALKPHCQVTVLDHYVEDLAGLFQRAKVYLYDSAEYWAQYGVSEGFGLPPLEAMACGCQVFSSVNGALADYLDPPFNCQGIGLYSTAYDVERILHAIAAPQKPRPSAEFFEPYREAQLIPRLGAILKDINQFFDHTKTHADDIPSLSPWRLTRLRASRLKTKLWQRLFKG